MELTPEPFEPSAYLAAIVNSSVDAIVSKNLSGVIQSWNKAAERIFGFSAGEAIGQPMLLIIPSHLHDEEAYILSRLREGHQIDHFETVRRRKDGTLLDVSLTVSPIRNATGTIIGASKIARDITQHKRALAASAEAQTRLVVTLQSIGDAVMAMDATSVVTFVNPVAEKLLGYPQKDLIGRPLANVFHIVNEETRRSIENPVERVLAEGTIVGLANHTLLLRSDGSEVPIADSAAPIMDSEGNMLGVVLVFRDVTEEHRTTRMAGLLSSIITSCEDAIISKDLSGTITSWNPGAERIFGYTSEEVVGRSIRLLIPPDRQDEEADILSRVTRGQRVDHYETFRRKKNGQLCEVTMTVSPLKDHDGRIIGASKIARDVTEYNRTKRTLHDSQELILRDVAERKRLEEQLRQAQKMDAVGRLAGGVAHDFNNLLTIITGYSAMLIDRLPPEDPRQKMAVETLKAGERASELTKQLLAFSRKQVLLPQPLNFNESLRLISSMLSRLLGEEVTLTLDLALDLWSINGDKGQLNQVTLNLAINARDAMPNGGTLTIATRNLSVTPEGPDRYRLMPPGDYVHVSVRDTGHGMSPETLSHLFEPFFTTKEVGQGTGLGLATVYGIVKQSQGYIFADSTPDQGTTFHLYYPRVIATPAVAKTPPVRPTKGSESLLVIEDQDSVRALIVQALKQDGYQVIEAANGEEALGVAASLSEPIQALVTDVIMPQMSGLVVAERLLHIWPGTKVLFMSGYVDPTKPAFLDGPGTAFIQKPFLPDELTRHLRDLLDRPI